MVRDERKVGQIGFNAPKLRNFKCRRCQTGGTFDTFSMQVERTFRWDSVDTAWRMAAGGWNRNSTGNERLN